MLIIDCDLCAGFYEFKHWLEGKSFQQEAVDTRYKVQAKKLNVLGRETADGRNMTIQINMRQMYSVGLFAKS